MSWTGHPFVRYTIALSAGIASAFLLKPDLVFACIGASVALLGFTIIHFLIPLQQRLAWKSVKGVVALLFLYFGGVLLLTTRQDTWLSSHFQNAEGLEYYKVELTGDVQEKENFFTITGEVISVYSGNKSAPATGSILLYFSKKYYEKPWPGQAFLIRGSPSNPQSARNPGEFDFGKYLTSRNIYYCHFLYKDDGKLLKQEQIGYIRSLGMDVKEYLLSRLKNDLPKEQASVAAALLLGEKKDLSQDTRQEYASAGLMHLLAVSGLHTGIIFQLLIMVFGFLKKGRSGQIVFTVICISGLWFYALLTGFSPSVLRAAFMFSCFLVARLLSRKPAAINTLAVSAFFLLVVNPFLLFDVGFQLSYAAVAGILLLLPLIQRKFQTTGKIASYFRDMAGISVAAQFFTFPLAIYYFHQFPVYFLFSNLLIVPVSVLSVYCGVAFFALAEVPYLGEIIAWIFKWMLSVQEYLVDFFATLPYPVVKGAFSVPELIILFALLSLILLFLKTLKFHFISMLLICSVLLVVCQVLALHNTFNRRQIIVFHVSAHTVVAEVTGDAALVHADLKFLKDDKKKQYLEKSLLAYNIKSVYWSLLGADLDKLIVLDNKKPLTIDFNPVIPLQEKDYIAVYDGRFRRNSKKLHQSAYNTYREGALILDLNE